MNNGAHPLQLPSPIVQGLIGLVLILSRRRNNRSPLDVADDAFNLSIAIIIVIISNSVVSSGACDVLNRGQLT